MAKRFTRRSSKRMKVEDDTAIGNDVMTENLTQKSGKRMKVEDDTAIENDVVPKHLREKRNNLVKVEEEDYDDLNLDAKIERWEKKILDDMMVFPETEKNGDTLKSLENYATNVLNKAKTAKLHAKDGKNNVKAAEEVLRPISKLSQSWAVKVKERQNEERTFEWLERTTKNSVVLKNKLDKLFDKQSRLMERCNQILKS
ncbi:hypothetical protein NE237_010916 [Protea cynaroides]|uniref:Uncharacterized protein n=1 Tax=Protea cynaroides TaxID=273540 RepID=A0A9Q0L1J0_9MAGN|nr:hypothetical protein NE237_010916 [Protea cynaroides]